MKSFTIIIWLTAAICCQAQLKPELRTVDGKLYDINRSTNWVTLPLIPHRTFTMVVVKSTSQGTLLQVYNPVLRNGRIEKDALDEYLVKNLPDEKNLTTSTKVKQIRVMRVGTVTIDGVTLGQYDYGIPTK
jgi:hypothetical protein